VENNFDEVQMLEALSSLSREDYLAILQDVDPVAWTENNRTLKGQPFSFENRNYLHDIYRDNSRHLIIYKGRQVEMTEFSINWLLNKIWQNPYTAGLHTFPRDGQVLRVSKQRVQPAIKDSTGLSSWYNKNESDQRMFKFCKPPNAKTGLIPYSFYILGGTWGSGGQGMDVGDAARGLTIDFTVYDERQDHPNDVEATVGEAMSHSEHKQSLTLGTPKLPGTQFDQEWESSNKKYWFVECPGCGREEPLTMDNILDVATHDYEGRYGYVKEWKGEEQDYYYGCKYCGEELDRTRGIWRETNPQRRAPYAGYHISQLMVAWITAQEIIDKKESVKYTKRKFSNEVLGIAYGGDDLPITMVGLQACCQNDLRLGAVDGESLYVGIDWGATSYMWIQKRCMKRGFQIVQLVEAKSKEKKEHIKQFVEVLGKYVPYVKKVVCDAGPDITNFQALRDKLREEDICHDVWACYYANPPAKKICTWNDKDEAVSAGRSEFIEMVADEIDEQRLVIPGKDQNLEVITTALDHMTNIAAERCETNSGVEFIKYVDTGPDHFLHAKVYANVAGYGKIVEDSVGSSAQNFQKPRETSINVRKKAREGGDRYGELTGGRRNTPESGKGFTSFTRPKRNGRR